MFWSKEFLNAFLVMFTKIRGTAGKLVLYLCTYVRRDIHWPWVVNYDVLKHKVEKNPNTSIWKLLEGLWISKIPYVEH